MNAITLTGLSKTYPTFQLGPLDLTLPIGSIMGLVGENGAGKSTTLKLILDLLRPGDGEIAILDQPVPASYPRLKEEVGVVLEELSYPAFLTARQVGRLMANAYRQWEPETYEGFLTRLDLPRDQAFSTLSRGMKMKLHLAVALSHGAKVLILDEPTSGLDPMVRQEILDLLYDFCDEEHAILISSHIVSDLEKICDYIAFLHKGKLVLMDEKDRLLERYGVLKCSPEELAKLDPEIILAQRIHHYGAEALVERDKVPDGLLVDKITLEELIIYMARGK